jgi:hypothetical protein
MFDIVELVNNELKQYNLKWRDFHEVKSLKNASMNSKKNTERTVKIIDIEFADHYEIRIFNLLSKTEVLFVVTLGTSYSLPQYNRREFSGDLAEDHFTFYKRLPSNYRHAVTCYTV